MIALRMFLVQTKMNFVWYFRRDGELIFWTLAMPVFFLVLFSFAFSTGPNANSSGFLVPGIIGAQVLSSGFWGVGVMLATFREKHLLRRVYLTPMPPWVFFASLVTYRIALLATQAIILIAASRLLRMNITPPNSALSAFCTISGFSCANLSVTIQPEVKFGGTSLA